jgi:hypothetical protein
MFVLPDPQTPFFFFWVGLGFELRTLILHLQSSAVLLELHFQSILPW